MELSEEQQAELAAALEGLNSDEAVAVEPPAPQVEEPVQESDPVQESEASQEEVLQTEPADEAADEEEPEEGHSVPYSRFSKVIAAKNQFASEVDQLKDEVNRLQAAEGELETLRRYGMQQQQQAPVEESFEDNLADPYDTRLQMLEARLGDNEREAKIREHMSEMEQQIAVIQHEHPNVDPVVLLQHVQANPDADLMDLAVNEAARVAEMRESVIADYLKDTPAAKATAPAAAPEVPPEIRSKSNSGSRGFAGAKPPTTWEQAHTQAAEAIKAAWTG